MIKKLSIIVLILISAGCGKGNKVKPGCPLQICTDVFVSVGVTFTDKNGQPIAINNFQAKDLTTNSNLTKAPTGIFWKLGYYVIADDSDLKKLSTDGDDIRVSATDPATNQTITAMFKIAGGCNCHVYKVSGPDTLAFN